MKKIRIALTDINGIDVMSGNKIEQEVEIKQAKDQKKRAREWLEKKQQDKYGRIYVEGLGYVKI